MTRLTLSLAGAIAATGLAASVAIRHSGQVGLREKAETFQQQAREVARLTAENERLSKLTIRTGSPQSLPADRLGELLRLRGQIGLLRQAGQEQSQLRATNAQLRAALAESEQQLADARKAPNFWAKEQLAFAGYAEPEAALRSLLWAMSNGDVKAYLACWVPGPEASGLLPYEGENMPDADAQLAAVVKLLTESLNPSIGFHVLDKQAKSPDQVVLNLSFDGEGKARRFLMKHVGSEWKIAEMLLPGEEP